MIVIGPEGARSGCQVNCCPFNNGRSTTRPLGSKGANRLVPDVRTWLAASPLMTTVALSDVMPNSSFEKPYGRWTQPWLSG